MNGFRWYEGYCFPDKPKAATAEDWSCWTKKAKEKKFCYFMTETLPLWYSVKRMRLRDVQMWFKYRLVNRHKYHLVNTGLDYGYYDTDTRLLHANFNLLKEFVEGELASMYKWSLSAEESKENLSPKEMGLAHLEWQCNLDGPENARQAQAAKDTKDLYLWWVETYPGRPDPHDTMWEGAERVDYASGQTFMEIMAGRSEKEKEASVKRYKKVEAVTKKYDAEDTRMLVRLIKIRSSLWT